MIEMKKQVTPGETPEQITISMIDQDLKDGVSKSDMAVKYGIKPWEVDEMFKHPLLKGRRPSRKKALSFSFVDDMTNEPIIDPNQVTLEQAIDEAIESVGEIKDQMQETQEAIIDMLSPTKFETPEESLLKAAQDEDFDEEAEERGAIEYDGQEIDTEDAYLPEVKDEELTPEETIAKVNGTEYDSEELDTDDSGLEIPSFEDTLDLVKEQQEEELEMDDDTFEL
jgi:hypothetical protein